MKQKQFRPYLTADDITYLLMLIQKDGTNPKLYNYLTQFKFKITHEMVSFHESKPKLSIDESLGFTSQKLTAEQYSAQLSQLPIDSLSDEDLFNMLAIKEERSQEEQSKYEEVCLKLYGFVM